MILLLIFSFLLYIVNNLLTREGQCQLEAASDCLAMCIECSINTQRFNLVAYTPTDEDNMDEEGNKIMEILHKNATHSSKEEPPGEVIHHYWVEGLRSSDTWENIR